jgi:hypothetical protein
MHVDLIDTVSQSLLPRVHFGISMAPFHGVTVFFVMSFAFRRHRVTEPVAQSAILHLDSTVSQSHCRSAVLYLYGTVSWSLCGFLLCHVDIIGTVSRSLLPRVHFCVNMAPFHRASVYFCNAIFISWASCHGVLCLECKIGVT